MEEDEIANLVGGDDSKKGWSAIVDKNLKMMKDNPQQLEAYNDILFSLDDPSPRKQRLFFVEGIFRVFTLKFLTLYPFKLCYYRTWRLWQDILVQHSYLRDARSKERGHRLCLNRDRCTSSSGRIDSTQVIQHYERCALGFSSTHRLPIFLWQKAPRCKADCNR